MSAQPTIIYRRQEKSFDYLVVRLPGQSAEWHLGQDIEGSGLSSAQLPHAMGAWQLLEADAELTIPEASTYAEVQLLPYGKALRLLPESERRALRQAHSYLIGVPEVRPTTLAPEAVRVFKGEIFDVYQWPQTLYDGSVATFERLMRPDTVVIVPVTSEGQLLLLNEEQPGKPAYVSFPGGRIEKDELPALAIERELFEETGYVFDDLAFLSVRQPVSKIDWNVYLFVARGCTYVGQPVLDPGERISLRPTSFEELVELVRSGQFPDNDLADIIQRALPDPEALSALRLSWLGTNL